MKNIAKPKCEPGLNNKDGQTELPALFRYTETAKKRAISPFEAAKNSLFPGNNSKTRVERGMNFFLVFSFFHLFLRWGTDEGAALAASKWQPRWMGQLELSRIPKPAIETQVCPMIIGCSASQCCSAGE